MEKVFLVKDENEDEVSKAFLGAYKKEKNAIDKVESFKLEVINKNKNLIYHKEFLISDKTLNPTKVYLVFNRLLGKKRQLVSIHYTALNAGHTVQSLRKNLSTEDKKHVFMKIYPLNN